jgi:hypothetical protein
MIKLMALARDNVTRLSETTMACLGGIFACIDAGIEGLILGTLLGLFIGEIGGQIVKSVLMILIGSPATETSASVEKAPSRSARRFAGRYVLLPLLVTLLIAVLHEFYWLANLTATAINFNTGAYLTQATSRGDSRDFIQRQLAARRWQHELVAARPAKWFLTAELCAFNQTNLELIDFINGKGIRERDSGLKDNLRKELLTKLWRTDHWMTRTTTDVALNAYGDGVCCAMKQNMGKFQRRSWLLRHLDGDIVP